MILSSLRVARKWLFKFVFNSKGLGLLKKKKKELKKIASRKANSTFFSIVHVILLATTTKKSQSNQKMIRMAMINLKIPKTIMRLRTKTARTIVTTTATAAVAQRTKK